MERGNRSLGDVLIQLMDKVSEAWTAPLDAALPDRQRFFYAFSGAFTWVLYNTTDQDWINILRTVLVESLRVVDSSAVVIAIAIMLLAQALAGAWFAWLVSYLARKCAPIQFFLEGLLIHDA